LDGVIEAIRTKMIRRHPHVFGDEAAAATPDEVERQWARLKEAERASGGPATPLAGVPRSLPPIQRAWRLQNKAASVGFDWPDADGPRAKFLEEWAELEEARASGDRESIVGTMVHGRDESGAGMTEQELIDNLLILALAGHETTASTLAWSMIHLANAPAAWERLVAEATAMDEVPSDWSALAERVPFALGVFRESLRLYPPVHVDSRRTHAPVELAGYTIPERTVVAASILLMSRDPERYPEPEAWRPERWGDRGRKPTAIENCQFGGGAHFCLGYHMALLEGTLFLVHAARELAAAGRRPELIGGIPRPRYMPVTRPPAGVEIALV
ncbi:MAG: cytochrome P450, partial [Myxococcales bacterium]|nr:cytochrome P450 [Myxococcales bacterium]